MPMQPADCTCILQCRRLWSALTVAFWRRLRQPAEAMLHCVPQHLSRIVCLLLLSAGLVLAGCDAPERGDRKAVVAGTTFPNTTGEDHWLLFRDRLQADSTVDMPLRMLIYGQLGSEDQLLSGLRRGRVQLANLSAMAASAVLPELALLYAPFLFDDAAEADYVYDRHLTPLFRNWLAAKGLHLLSWYEIGFLQIYGKEPLLSPADMQGRRFRVGAGPAPRLFGRQLGADVIPLGFADVVPSLQTGLVEAGENSVSLYARTGIATEAPHLTMTDHGFGVSVIVASKTWWDGLTSAEQLAVTAAWPTAARTRADVRAESAADLAAGSELGIVVHRISPKERAAWREAAAPVTRQLIRTIGGRAAELYELVEDGRRDYAQQHDQPTEP